MLVKYWIPVAVLVIAQVVWTSWVSAEEPKNVQSAEGLSQVQGQEMGDISDLETAEIFLRLVLFLYKGYI